MCWNINAKLEARDCVCVCGVDHDNLDWPNWSRNVRVLRYGARFSTGMSKYIRSCLIWWTLHLLIPFWCLSPREMPFSSYRTSLIFVMDNNRFTSEPLGSNYTPKQKPKKWHNETWTQKPTDLCSANLRFMVLLLLYTQQWGYTASPGNAETRRTTGKKG